MKISHQKGRKHVVLGPKALFNQTRWCGLGKHAKGVLEGGGSCAHLLATHPKSATLHTAVSPSCTCFPAHVTPYVNLFVIIRNARLLAANSFASPWDLKKQSAHSTVPSGSNDAHNFMMFLASKFPAAVP